MSPDMINVSANISIHALREEGDLFSIVLDLVSDRFLSTPSARRATGVYICEACGTDISIHALREEGDVDWVMSNKAYFDFYPRPPRGGRLQDFHAKLQNS